MNERVKELRKKLNLTQQEFADKIGMKRNTVANYETNRNEPSNSVISLICREFNVSETWLRTGEGEMFIEPATFSLDKYAAERGATDLELAVAKAYFDLPQRVRAEMLATLKSLLNSVDDIPNPSSKTLDEEADEVTAIFREGWISERKMESLASSVKESGAG